MPSKTSKPAAVGLLAVYERTVNAIFLSLSVSAWSRARALAHMLTRCEICVERWWEWSSYEINLSFLGKHTTPEYLQNVNRFGKVPAIVDGKNFKLAESIAILRYLAREFAVPDHWYPRDSRRRARVDEYLEWQHSNTRLHCAGYVCYVWRGPLRGETMDPRVAKRLKAEMVGCLDFIESNVLQREARFIAGDEISIADLVATCEIEQPSECRRFGGFYRMINWNVSVLFTELAGYDARVGRPHLTAWMQRVKETTQPDYDEAHKILNKFAPTTT